MSTEETRYRRLLALYPAEFRREYADEMLGVLMADPRPARSQAVNLVAGAVAARLRPVFADPAWRRAARTVQLFGAILLCALAVRRLVTSGAPAYLVPGGLTPRIDVLDLVRVVAWAAVVAAALTGVRVAGVAAALVGLGAEIVAPARLYTDTPVMFLRAYWIVVAAAVVLVAATVPAREPGRHGWRPVVAAGVSLIVNGLTPWSLGGPYIDRLLEPGPARPYLLPRLPVLVAALLLVWALIRLEPPVRRRVVACAVPVLGAFSLVPWGFGGLVEFNEWHPEATRLLGPGQWAALVAVPVLAFGVAALLNTRLERTRAQTAAASGNGPGSPGRGLDSQGPVSGSGVPEM